MSKQNPRRRQDKPVSPIDHFRAELAERDRQIEVLYQRTQKISDRIVSLEKKERDAESKSGDGIHMSAKAQVNIDCLNGAISTKNFKTPNFPGNNQQVQFHKNFEKFRMINNSQLSGWVEFHKLILDFKVPAIELIEELDEPSKKRILGPDYIESKSLYDIFDVVFHRSMTQGDFDKIIKKIKKFYDIDLFKVHNFNLKQYQRHAFFHVIKSLHSEETSNNIWEDVKRRVEILNGRDSVIAVDLSQVKTGKPPQPINTPSPDSSLTVPELLAKLAELRECNDRQRGMIEALNEKVFKKEKEVRDLNRKVEVTLKGNEEMHTMCGFLMQENDALIKSNNKTNELFNSVCKEFSLNKMLKTGHSVVVHNPTEGCKTKVVFPSSDTYKVGQDGSITVIAKGSFTISEI